MDEDGLELAFEEMKQHGGIHVPGVSLAWDEMYPCATKGLLLQDTVLHRSAVEQLREVVDEGVNDERPHLNTPRQKARQVGVVSLW